MTELGGGVDPLEVDLLGGPSAGLGVKGLAQGHDTLLNTRDGTLEQDEVVLNLTVADEATKTATVSGFEQVKRGRGTYGVICFLETSKSVEALASSEPFPMRKTLWLQEVRWW